MPDDNAQPLRVSVTELDGRPLLAPVGEVDIASVPSLEEQFQKLLHDGRAQLVVDLAQVTYLDSTGLGCLAGARRAAREAGGDLVVVCASERVLRLFRITGLDQVFTIVATQAAAVAAFGPGS